MHWKYIGLRLNEIQRRIIDKADMSIEKGK
jgi:hypothetical protein